MKPTDTPQENSLGKQGDYSRLLTEIKERIRSAQYKALKAVNKERGRSDAPLPQLRPGALDP